MLQCLLIIYRMLVRTLVNAAIGPVIITSSMTAKPEQLAVLNCPHQRPISSQ